MNHKELIITKFDLKQFVFSELTSIFEGLKNLTKIQIEVIISNFIISVKETELFGHFINKEDLLEELKFILIYIDKYSEKMVFGQKLQMASSQEYDEIFRSFLEEMIIHLDEKVKKYFAKHNQFGAKTWYSVHLQTTLAYIFNGLKNL